MAVEELTGDTLTRSQMLGPVSRLDQSCRETIIDSGRSIRILGDDENPSARPGRGRGVPLPHF